MLNNFAKFMRESYTARFLIPVGIILIVVSIFVFMAVDHTKDFVKTDSIVSRMELYENQYTDDEGNFHEATYTVYVKYNVDETEYENELGVFSSYKVNDKVIVSSTITAITLIPMIKFAKLYYDNKKITFALSQMKEKSNLLYPTSPEEYESWLGYAPVENVEKFNTLLYDLKAKGELSENFLHEHNFNTTNDFENYLDSLYDLGKNGDTTAQQQFLEIYDEYQNDFFYQAVGKYKELNGADLGANTDVPPIDIDKEFEDVDIPVFEKTTTDTNIIEIAVGVAISAMAILLCADVYFEYKKRKGLKTQQKSSQNSTQKYFADEQSK